MTLGGLTGPAAYTVIFLASAVEGEVVFVAASVLVGVGGLSALPVLVSGAAGAAVGDQFFYYAARGWLGMSRRIRPNPQRADRLREWVRAHGMWMGFACRFLPGLRIAVAAASAAVGVPALIFSLSNLLGAVTWAASVMAFVAWGGPASLARLGLPGWTVWTVPPLIVLALFALISRRPAKELPPEGGSHGSQTPDSWLPPSGGRTTDDRHRI
jgi:membrane protein DedA with SNARE-associated domain